MPSSASSLRNMLKSYADIRLLWIFLLGCASGFPWVLIGSSMSGWLQDAGISRSTIGFFGSIFVVYAIHFMWAPLIDRVKLPFLHARLGQRRSWICLMQVFILLATVGIAFTNPANSLLWTAVLAFTIAVASSTQDIAIDAYRIDTLYRDKALLPQGSAMAVIGWWTGYSLPGYLAFSYADRYGWQHVYLGMAAISLVWLCGVLLAPEPETGREHLQAEAEQQYAKHLHNNRIITWLAVTVIEPFAEFFRRNGTSIALSIISFVFLFKIGEAFLGRMSITFYKEIGFSNEQIAHYSKLIGWFAMVVFTLMGSALNVRFGIVRGLLIGGIAMAGSNLMFAWIATVGPNEHLFAATIIVDNFTSAFSSVAFVSFLSWLSGRAFSATQYALLSSLGNLGRTTLSSFSGEMVDRLHGNWSLFFICTSLMVIPGLLLLIYVGKRFSALTRDPESHPKQQPE
ncbi:MAG: AmpG family muropeptide MFS transporter [Plesiomonas sp.]|uniref:AmpG family muropeptide MFS transporter n=1 Tax=Plesiomonas sp. TaxID=2486279 RepID=UPI003F3E29F7